MYIYIYIYILVIVNVLPFCNIYCLSYEGVIKVESLINNGKQVDLACL